MGENNYNNPWTEKIRLSMSKDGIRVIDDTKPKVNSIIEFKGTMFIGTDKGLYYLDDDKKMVLVKEGD